MNDVNNKILVFVNASIENGIAQEDGNANQANKYYRVFKDCKTIMSFGLSRYLVDSCEVIMAVDEKVDRSTSVLSNALFI